VDGITACSNALLAVVITCADETLGTTGLEAMRGQVSEEFLHQV